MLHRISGRLTRICQTAVDLVLPPRCIGTGEIVGHTGAVSPAFFRDLTFVTAPLCDCCGLPFGFDVPAGTLCTTCLDTPPLYDRARAAVVYNDSSRQVVLRFKHGDRQHAARTFAPWMARAGADILADTDIVIPVPLHPRRLWARRFNQSAILAGRLAKITGRKHLPDGMIRVRHTAMQRGLSRKERRKNVAGAFAVNLRHITKITGKNVTIVDDVYTSGATLNECARVLKQAGAAKVYVLAFARVVRDFD